MPKIESEKAAKAGHMLFRYMRARHRFKNNVEPPLPAHELAELIGGGKEEFDEVYIEPAASPPIVFDGKADDVFEAIIQQEVPRYCVLGRPAGGGLAALRHQRWASATKTGAAGSVIRPVRSRI
jgi:hypothetical protein